MTLIELAYNTPRTNCIFDYRGRGYRARLANVSAAAESAHINAKPFALVIEGPGDLVIDAFVSLTEAREAAAYEIGKRELGGMVASNVDSDTYFIWNDNEITADTPDDFKDARVGTW